MKSSIFAKLYIVLVVVLLGAFAYTGARGIRIISLVGSSHWHHEYTPGVHMLRHK